MSSFFTGRKCVCETEGALLVTARYRYGSGTNMDFRWTHKHTQRLTKAQRGQKVWYKFIQQSLMRVTTQTGVNMHTHKHRQRSLMNQSFWGSGPLNAEITFFLESLNTETGLQHSQLTVKPAGPPLTSSACSQCKKPKQNPKQRQNRAEQSDRLSNQINSLKTF